MATDVYDDAIVDIVGEDTLITNTVTVKVKSFLDSHTHTFTHDDLGSPHWSLDRTVTQFFFSLRAHCNTA